MKIAYVANHAAGGNEDERHIAEALASLGHEVVRIPEMTMRPEMVRGADLLLFHHWYVVDIAWLAALKMPKVCWYFDKVWNGRDRWVRRVAPICTRFFLSDATWARQAGIASLTPLRQGIGALSGGAGVLGAERSGVYQAKIAHVGSLYGERAKWASGLEARFPGHFRAFQGVHGRALYDLCATVPIMVAPHFPSDDGYWSNRLYLLLGSGAFLIHPRLAEIAGEYTEGKHLEMYEGDDELYHKVERYLADPARREKIRRAGFERTHKLFTYRHRCEEMLRQTFEPASTGTIA